jgi:tryptophan-rich sensory protein
MDNYIITTQLCQDCDEIHNVYVDRDNQNIAVTVINCEKCQKDITLDPNHECVSFTDLYKSWTYIIIILVTLLVYIPFIISYLAGIYSPFYNSLKLTTNNPWIARILWVITTIISYIGLYILYHDLTPEKLSQNLTVSVLFLIGNFILLAWSVTLFQFKSIALSVWIVFALFVYEFWVFTYVWNINRVASLFLLPLLGMYLFFVYDSVHLAFLNGIIL